MSKLKSKLPHRQQLSFYVVMTFLLISLSSCGDRGFVTPPAKNLGSSLNSKAAEQYPHFSYDGRYLVFASDRRQQRSIFFYELLSRRLLELPGLNQPGSIQDQPDISADGRYIVYVSEQLGKPDIFVYDRKTGKAEAITKDILGEVRHPSLSGNGRFITFEINRSGQWDLEIYDRGSGIELSIPQAAGNISPSPEQEE
ncbi:MAG: biopolymer transporter [Spirulinaceae cyanobacterium]